MGAGGHGRRRAWARARAPEMAQMEGVTATATAKRAVPNLQLAQWRFLLTAQDPTVCPDRAAVQAQLQAAIVQHSTAIPRAASAGGGAPPPPSINLTGVPRRAWAWRRVPWHSACGGGRHGPVL